MADTDHLRAAKSRRRIRDLFKRPSRTTSSLNTSASRTPVQPSTSQLPLRPALASSSLLGSNSLQPPAPASTPILEGPKLPLSSQHSTRSLNLWEEVFCKTNTKTQEWIQKQGLESLATAMAKPEDQMKQLTDLIKKKELSFEEKNSPIKIKIGNQEIVFRAFIADVVGFLTMAGDVAINFAPPQASIPWAAARAVLQIPVKEIEQMAALAGIVQLFTRIVRRGQVYEVLYDDEILIKDGTISNLRSILVDLYVSATELLARCDVLVEGGVVRQTLNAILRPEQVSDLTSDLLKKEQTLSFEIQSCEALRREKATKQLDEKMKAFLARLDIISSPLTRIDEGVAKLLQNFNNEDDKLEKLMDFISNEQFGKGHATIKDTRIQGTGDWLIDHESFREWQAIASSSTLFCLKGTVGTGKTFLTSRVVDHIKETLETAPHDEGFAFFYCSRSGPSMQDPLIVLRSFVRQLSYKANNYSYIQRNVIQRCEMAKKEGRSLSYTDCKELILESINLYSKTTIILDALDESDISSYNLAEIMIDLLNKSRKPVKIFISSRPDREFLEAFETKAAISVNSSNQQGDIDKYLVEVLYSTKSFKKRQTDIQRVMKETFSSRNGGMFRWVYLQTKSLQKCVSDDAIRTWAKTIPRDLMAAYDRLWEDIKSEHNESDMALAMRTIKWVLCSYQPLKSSHLLEAIRYTYESDCLIQVEPRTEQEILSLCQDILTVDAERKVWMLPHASVAEYFESKGIILDECDAFVSKIMLDILMAPEPQIPSDTKADPDLIAVNAGEDDKRELFKRYSERMWFRHVYRYDRWLGSSEDISPETELTTALKRFLGSPAESSVYCRRWMNSLRGELKSFGGTDTTAMYAMYRYGFYYTLRDWWETDKVDPRLALTECRGIVEDEQGVLVYMLENSLVGGSMPIWKYLLSAIGTIDAAGLRQGRYWEAAQIAIWRRNKEFINFLLEEAKIDLNTMYRGTNWGLDWTLAQDAAMRDDTDMLQWMVDQGRIDVSRQGGLDFGNVLIAAAYGGRLQSVETLLRAGADAKISAENGKYGSALIAAAAARGSAYPMYEGNEDYEAKIMILLNSGADINQVPRAGNYGSALEAFVRRIFDTGPSNKILQPKQILELLLKSGADPTMTCDIGEHGSALAAAAFCGLKEFLMMMIDATGKERAIECLRQSRRPSDIEVYNAEAWKKNVAEVVTYLADEVGVDEETLRSIGIQGVTLKAEQVENNVDADGPPKWIYTIEEN